MRDPFWKILQLIIYSHYGYRLVHVYYNLILSKVILLFVWSIYLNIYEYICKCNVTSDWIIS